MVRRQSCRRHGDPGRRHPPWHAFASAPFSGSIDPGGQCARAHAVARSELAFRGRRVVALCARTADRRREHRRFATRLIDRQQLRGGLQLLGPERIAGVPIDGLTATASGRRHVAVQATVRTFRSVTDSRAAGRRRCRAARRFHADRWRRQPGWQFARVEHGERSRNAGVAAPHQRRRQADEFLPIIARSPVLARRR